MVATAQQSLRVGLKKGLKVNRPVASGERPSRRKGKLNNAVKVAREVIRDVAGLAPYEKHILDVIKTGGSTAEKRALKYAKLRLGGHRRALKKREEIKGLVSKMRTRA